MVREELSDVVNSRVDLSGVYQNGGLIFADTDKPNYFVVPFLQLLYSNGITPDSNGVVAVLGSGVGADDYEIAEHYNVVSFEKESVPRIKMLARFKNGGLESRLTIKEDYKEIETLHPHSVSAAYGVSSTHYGPPPFLQNILLDLEPTLTPDAVVFLALKTINASWPIEHQMERIKPHHLFDLGNLGVSLNGHDPNVIGYDYDSRNRVLETRHGQPGHDPHTTRFYYTPEQLQSVAEASGYQVLVRGIWHGVYDRPGKIEEFVYIGMRPRR